MDAESDTIMVYNMNAGATLTTPSGTTWKVVSPMHPQSTPPRLCSIDGCDHPAEKRGWCDMHYKRWRRHGDPSLVLSVFGKRERQTGTTEERFWANTQKSVDCWHWTARKNPDGYGQLWTGGANARNVSAHRYSYELHKGPIPDGLQIDHLCRNPCCVNPDHLEAVTHHENARRGNIIWAVVRRTGLCVRGHRLTPDNVYTRPSRPNERACRKCARLRKLKRMKSHEMNAG